MAGNTIWFLVFILSTICIPQVWSFGETYRGAVVEYNPVMIDKNTPEQVAIQKNVEKYIEFIAEAKTKGAEIIVFPEGGLFTAQILSSIPEPYKKIVPCDGNFDTTEHVKKLSCASKNNKIYSVINLMEKRNCNKNVDENCPPKGYYTYNTNVAFDHNGTVIARYAKYNIFNAILSDKPKTPEISFFDTSFGVRFGTFTCFDILFGIPTLQMVKQFGISNFVFPTFWFSELPFLTALQAQRGWAESNNVNLLASGVNSPKNGSAGSGIYNGMYGPLVQIMPEVPTSTLLIADIPKSRPIPDLVENNSYKKMYRREASKSLEPADTYNRTDIVYVNKRDARDSEYTLLHDQIHLYNSAVIESGKRFDKKLCSRNNFCCNFQVSLQRTSKNHTDLVYRAVVSDGVRMYGDSATGGVQCCGVIVCKGPNLLHCTSRTKDLPGVYKVSEMYVEGEFLKRNSFQMPTTLIDGKKLAPLPTSSYVFEKEVKSKSIKVSLELVWPTDNLHTFAIYGRDFTRDGEPPTVVKGDAPMKKSSAVLLITSIFFVIFRF